VKRPNFLVKLTAVASSVVLGGGCVSYFGGAFNSLLPTTSRPAERTAAQEPQSDVSQPGEPTAPLSAAPQQKSKPELEKEPIFMSGTKSLGNAGGVLNGLAPGGAVTSNLDIPVGNQGKAPAPPSPPSP
jgi:hypothetical protein